MSNEKKKFKESAISRKINVEMIDKDSLASMLIAATDKTSKREYQKIKHAAKLLEMLNVDEVRKASTHCDRLFIRLTQIIDPVY